MGQQPALVSGYNVGAYANFAVVGWSGNIGSTWAQAESWWNNGNPLPNETPGVSFNFSISTVGTTAIAPVYGPWDPVFAAPGYGEIPGMTLGTYFVVPEPATLGLAGLGAAALAIFRRRCAARF